VPAALAGLAECAWVHAISAQATDARCSSHLILPHSGVSLACLYRRDMDGRMHNPLLALIGPIARPRRFPIEPGAEIAAVRLYPEHVLALLGTRASEHCDEVQDITPLLRKYANSMLDALAATRNWRQACGLLEGLLIALHQETRISAQQARQQQAVLALRNAPVRRPVAKAAAELGISPRQLQRRVYAAIGMTPKVYSRGLRFNRALVAADVATQPDWAAVAQATGYVDQAHLAHEFRELCACAPGSLMRERRLESSLYAPKP